MFKLLLSSCCDLCNFVYLVDLRKRPLVVLWEPPCVRILIYFSCVYIILYHKLLYLCICRLNKQYFDSEYLSPRCPAVLDDMLCGILSTLAIDLTASSE